MDEFDKVIANLRRLRSDMENAAPIDSTVEIVRKIEELQRRIDSVHQQSEHDRKRPSLPSAER